MYFCEHRSLATGIATAGSGLGCTVFPIVMYFVIQEYAWQGSLFIVAALNLHLFVFGALLRPVSKKQQEKILRQEKLLELKSIDKKDGDLSDEMYKEMKPLCKQKLNGEIAVETNGRMNSSNEIAMTDITEVDETNENSALQERKKSEPIIIENKAFSKKEDTNPPKSLRLRLIRHFKNVFNFDFIIYWLSNVCWNAGIAILLLFMAEYAVSHDMAKETGSLLLTVSGAGSCIGCVLGGWLGNLKKVDRVVLYILANLMVGFSTFLVTWPTARTVSGLVVVNLLIGLGFGVILGLLVVVTSDLLGLEALGDGFGYLMLANGIGVFSGPPLGGKI